MIDQAMIDYKKNKSVEVFDELYALVRLVK